MLGLPACMLRHAALDLLFPLSHPQVVPYQMVGFDEKEPVHSPLFVTMWPVQWHAQPLPHGLHARSSANLIGSAPIMWILWNVSEGTSSTFLAIC